MSTAGTVVVCGASSQVGVFALPRLLASGFAVQALGRGAPRPPADAGGVRWSQAGDCPGAAHFLLSCGPMALAVDFAQRLDGLEKAVVFSSSSVHTKTASADEEERALVAGIASGEGQLKRICADRGIALVLVRPTLVYGCGRDRNLSLLLGLGERFGFIPLSRNAGGLRQPVHADDLAALAVTALIRETGPLLEAEACGGSTLSYRSMLKKVAACGQRDIRLLTLPAPLLSGLVRLAALTGRWPGLNPEMVRRQSTDLLFDDTPFRDTLDYAPRAFDPGPDEFQVPPHCRPHQLP